MTVHDQPVRDGAAGLLCWLRKSAPKPQADQHHPAYRLDEQSWATETYRER